MKRIAISVIVASLFLGIAASAQAVQPTPAVPDDPNDPNDPLQPPSYALVVFDASMQIVDVGLVYFQPIAPGELVGPVTVMWWSEANDFSIQRDLGWTFFDFGAPGGQLDIFDDGAPGLPPLWDIQGAFYFAPGDFILGQAFNWNTTDTYLTLGITL